jgi:hypothetical protein
MKKGRTRMGKLIERKSGGLRMSLPRTNSLASEMLKRKRHARDAGSMVKEAPQDVSPTIPPSISPAAGFKVEDDKDVNPAISSMLGSKVEDDYDLFDVDGPIFQILAGIIAIVTIPIFLGVQGCRAIRMKMRNKDHEETGNPEAVSKQLESQVARTDSPENSVFMVYIDQDGNRVSIDEAGNKISVKSLESTLAEVCGDGETSKDAGQPVADGGEEKVSDLPSNSTIERLRVLERAEKKNRGLKLTLKTEILSLPNEERNNSINPAKSNR